MCPSSSIYPSIVNILPMTSSDNRRLSSGITSMAKLDLPAVRNDRRSVGTHWLTSGVLPSHCHFQHMEPEWPYLQPNNIHRHREDIQWSSIQHSLLDRKQASRENLSIINSIVGQECQLGDNVSIHNSVVGNRVTLGENSSIQSVDFSKEVRLNLLVFYSFLQLNLSRIPIFRFLPMWLSRGSSSRYKRLLMSRAILHWMCTLFLALVITCIEYLPQRTSPFWICRGTNFINERRSMFGIFGLSFK